MRMRLLPFAFILRWDARKHHPLHILAAQQLLAANQGARRRGFGNNDQGGPQTFSEATPSILICKMGAEVWRLSLG